MPEAVDGKRRARIEKLSKRTVDQSAPESARYTVWDRDLKGFGLQVAPSGQKTYVVRYRVGGGRRAPSRQLTIGRHGPLTPDAAREKALRALAQVADGRDPQSEKDADRRRISMIELCDLYLREGVATKKPMTIRLDTLRIERHIKPMLGRLAAADVKRADIERAMQAIGEGKLKGEVTAHMRGGRGAASRVVGLLGGIFTFAVSRGVRADNPVRGVKRFKDNKRERFLSGEELAALGEALRAAEQNGANPSHVAIVRLLALSGARKNEIARLKWSEVSLQAGFLQLEDSKTGRKVIRLGAAALELLAGLSPTSSTYVFPDPRDPSQPVRNLDWFWVGLRKRAGLNDLRLHDLRHSFASIGVSGGAGLYLVGKLLGHAHAATTSRYAHLHDDPLVAAADRISSAVAAAMDPGPANSRVIRGLVK